jgi:hypothetical protein
MMQFRIPKSKQERERRLKLFRKDEIALQQRLKDLRLRIWMLEAEAQGWGCTATLMDGKAETCRFFEKDVSRGVGCAHQPKPSPKSPINGIVLCAPLAKHFKDTEDDHVSRCPEKFS